MISGLEGYDWETIWWTFFWSATFFGELKVGIPFALYNNMRTLSAYLFCSSANCLAFPVTIYFLDFAHSYLQRYAYYRNVIGYFIEKSREKTGPLVKKYGYLGLTVLIMIPLPMTGAYIASLGAWVLKLDRRKAFIYVVIGCFLAGIVVTSVIQGGTVVYSLF